MQGMVVFKLAALHSPDCQYSLCSRRSQSPINCIRPSVLGPIKRKGMCLCVLKCCSVDVILQQDAFFSSLLSCKYNALVSKVIWNLLIVISKLKVRQLV